MEFINWESEVCTKVWSSPSSAEMFELYHQTYTKTSNWLHMFKKIGKRKSNWEKTWTTDFSNTHFNKDGTEFSKNPYHRTISRNHTWVRSTTDHGSINDSIMISLSWPRTWPTTLGQHIHFSDRCMFAPCSGRDLPHPKTAWKRL